MKETCVLVPHYDNPNGLSKSILSIRENVDILIVDDGSRDIFDEKIIEDNFKGHGNVFFLYLKKNRGIEYALNKGLEYLKLNSYEYVARLDCGDVCHENRFRIQVDFLKNNKEIQLVGTWAKVLDLKDNFLFKVKPPLDHHTLKNKMYYNCMFIHPTIMFRLSIIDKIGFYPYEYEAAEDYAFCFKVIKRFKTANIGEYLVSYQIDPHSISSVKRKRQVLSRIKIIKEHFYFGFYPIVGLFRNCLLLLLPIKTLNKLKLILKK